MYTNLYSTLSFVEKGGLPNVTRFIQEQHQYMLAKVAANPNDAFWVQTGLVLDQFDGLVGDVVMHVKGRVA